MADIYTRCVSEVRHGLAGVLQELDNGELVTFNPGQVGALFIDMARAHIEAGNADKAAWYLRKIVSIPGVGVQTMAEACFLSINTGNSYAYDTVCQALDEEKQTVQIQDSDTAPLLTTIVDACRVRGLPPDMWIKRYAANPVQHWQHYIHHYHMSIEEGSPDNTIGQGQLDAKIAELLTTSAFSEVFIHSETAYALRLARDMTLRKQLIRRFRQSHAAMDVTLESFEELVLVGRIVLQDVDLRSTEQVDFFESEIKDFARQLHEAGVESQLIARRLVAWELLLHQYHGASPAKVLDLLNRQTRRLLNTAATNGQKEEDLQDTTIAVRDGLLDWLAVRAASQRDFTGAHVFLSGIVHSSILEHAQKQCLALASNDSDIATIRPDAVSLEMHPILERLINFAEMRQDENPAKLIRLAKDIARDIHSSSEDTLYDLLEEIHSSVSERDQQAGIELARELLDILRASGQPQFKLNYLSDALLEVGDVTELEYLVTSLNTKSVDPSQHLLEMWRLAQIAGSVQPYSPVEKYLHADTIARLLRKITENLT